MEILYSIIIPHHNTPDLLQRCLDSIPDIETFQVIVVDDNSDPTIVDFDNVRNHGRANTEVYLTKEGRGAGYARNVGLKHAKGHWLLFADSDDFFELNLEQILDRYKDSTCDMILFRARSVYSDTLQPANRNENINGRIAEALNGDITAKEASIRVQSPWCRLINREFVEKNVITFDEVMSSNDVMFTTKCTCLAKKIDVADSSLYVVTYREGSLWQSRKTNPKNYLTRIKVMINRNKYVKPFGFKPLPIFGYVIKAKSIGLATLIKAICIAVKERALFQGFSFYLRKTKS